MVEALRFLCCICNQWNTGSSMVEENPFSVMDRHPVPDKGFKNKAMFTLLR